MLDAVRLLWWSVSWMCSVSGGSLGKDGVRGGLLANFYYIVLRARWIPFA